MKKEKILTYKISPQEFASISGYYGDTFEVIDESTCFEDVLSLPATMIVLNPEALTEAEYEQLDDLFQWDSDTMLVFSAKPKRPERIKYSYYVEDDFSHPDGSTWGTDELLRQKNEYELAVQAKDQLLSDIDALITPAEELSVVSKSAGLMNGTLLYQHLTDVIRYMKESVKPRERVAFRYEIISILLSMKLAYGLIEEDTAAPFWNDLPEDSEWIIALSEQIRAHRNAYLEHGNSLYVPKKTKKRDD